MQTSEWDITLEWNVASELFCPCRWIKTFWAQTEIKVFVQFLGLSAAMTVVPNFIVSGAIKRKEAKMKKHGVFLLPTINAKNMKLC